MKRPFIYISSLMRTGSTVLSEALTLFPHSFIFREPHLGKNYFALKDTDAERFAQRGVNLRRFVHFRLAIAFVLRRLRAVGHPQDYIVRAFKEKLMPQLLTCVDQIGVKEIKQWGWQNYTRHFPNMKVLMTGRDPRDIYISLYYMRQKDALRWDLPFTPEAVAEELLKQFDMQLKIRHVADCMLIRYEDLCTDPRTYDEIKRFVRSPIPEIGAIGKFNARHRKRADEFQIHGEEITAQRVNRWRSETDEAVLADAGVVFRHMAGYCEFWGYRENTMVDRADTQRLQPSR